MPLTSTIFTKTTMKFFALTAIAAFLVAAVSAAPGEGYYGGSGGHHAGDVGNHGGYRSGALNGLLQDGLINDNSETTAVEQD
ncbi:hypothetical protein EC973_008179 [Apophysomyces ossiformis]|uniref:Uncharacterized protein n=1 Tax=Apophysomyces ossiformis TaxID=679940 RepID=A0A8H7BT73_9FUNG|nr:hypothetical protein EC973_008179 [Apophysomyces ossiformis]